MISLKLIPTSFSRYLPARKAWSPRAFIAASPQLPKSEKDKKTIEACENVKEAASAVKEGATAVKNTSEYVKETASSPAKNVNKMTKEVRDKTNDFITDVAMETTEIMKDNVIKKK